MASNLPKPVVQLQLTRPEPGIYGYTVSCAGSALFSDIGYSSLTAALGAAADDGAEFLGFQLDYQGVVVGTYTVEELRAGAAPIAELCVERHAVFSHHL